MLINLKNEVKKESCISHNYFHGSLGDHSTVKPPLPSIFCYMKEVSHATDAWVKG